jgi:hypothetical protein
MRRLVYFSPLSPNPSGGVKVIYRHVDLINAMARPHATAAVYHFDGPGRQCDWYEGTVTLKTDPMFLADRDFVVLPECHLQDFWQRFSEQSIRYAIFVQNAYLVGSGAPWEAIASAYRRASLILSISDDTTMCLQALFPELSARIVPVRWSLSPERFRPIPDPPKVISFMPRRMGDHAMNVRLHLRGRLPNGWALRPIDGLKETQVAQALASSRIFMAFSGLEGLALPPAEAALCGNRVVGYHGQGGREYWDSALFREVAVGDIRGFAAAVLEEVDVIEREVASGRPDAPRIESMRIARNLLAWRFSPEREAALLRAFVDRALDCMPSGPQV